MSDEGFDVTDIDAMARRLDELRSKHGELAAEIEKLETAGEQAFHVMTLKREKLRVKDRIVWLSSKLTPDIIA